MEKTETTTRKTKPKVIVHKACGHDFIARTDPENPYYKTGVGYYCRLCNQNTNVLSVERA